MVDSSIRFVLRSADMLAVLGRDVHVRLVNISNSGCLVVCNRRLQEGLTGSLRIAHDDLEYSDDVRVVRCSSIEGSSEYHVGVEFLWTSTPGEHSMRRFIASLQAAAARAAQAERRL